MLGVPWKRLVRNSLGTQTQQRRKRSVISFSQQCELLENRALLSAVSPTSADEVNTEFGATTDGLTVEWLPYVLSPDLTEIEVTVDSSKVAVDTTVTANVRLTLGGGNRITNWGKVTRQGNKITADVQVERQWGGPFR